MKEAFWRFTEFVGFSVAGLLGLLGLTIALAMTLLSDGLEAVTLGLGVSFGILPMLVSLWLFRSVHQSSIRRRAELAERRILKLATNVGGWLTSVQVARSTRLTLEESKRLLDRLEIEGHCESALSENGVISYRFRDLPRRSPSKPSWTIVRPKALAKMAWTSLLPGSTRGSV